MPVLDHQSALKGFLKPYAKKFFASSFYRYWKSSSGDWRYIYLPVFWWIARTLTRRRKVRSGNISFTLPCDNWITHFRWYLFRSKEVEVREYIDNYVNDGDVFFDIGANIGVFSVYACKKHRDLKVFCFEPEYSNLHYLKENILANGLMGQASIYSVAVSDIDALSMLHIQDTTPGSAVHSENEADIDLTDEGYEVIWREGVAASTLDTIVERLGVVPNAIKIDTDGNEGKILSGGAKTLGNEALRSIVIEMPPKKETERLCEKLLLEADFKLAWSRADTRNQIWVRGPSSDS